MISLLLIDDEQDWLVSFKRTLKNNKIADPENIYTANTEEEAFQILKKYKIDLVFLDLILGSASGKDVLQSIKSAYPEITVIIMSGINDIHVALECGKLGATDYIVKTALIDELVSNIQRLLKINRLEKENTALISEIFSPSNEFPAYDSFITMNTHMKTVFKYLTAISVSSYPILITGESGVGKGVLAKAIAEQSRPGKPFVSINVGGLDTQIFSDTLFGHKKGAYTSAESNRMGAVQQAADGTLFLDEIAELPVSSQLKLLYLTQDGNYQQLGSDKTYKSNARLLFATNQNLEEKCRNGFRKDLYYRLKTHFVHIPPLRERTEDIPLLFNHFISKAATEFRKEVPEIAQNAIDFLCTCQFPGNARQLRALCYDLIASSSGRTITIADIKVYLNSAYPELTPAAENTLPTVDELIDQLIEKAMHLCNNNQTKAAAIIGLSQSTLSRRLKKINM